MSGEVAAAGFSVARDWDWAGGLPSAEYAITREGGCTDAALIPSRRVARTLLLIAFSFGTLGIRLCYSFWLTLVIRCAEVRRSAEERSAQDDALCLTDDAVVPH
jgi:hypothetical protein